MDINFFYEIVIIFVLAILTIYYLIRGNIIKILSIGKTNLKIKNGYLFIIFSDNTVIPIEYDENLILKDRKIKIEDKEYDLYPGIKTNHKDVVYIEEKSKYRYLSCFEQGWERNEQGWERNDRDNEEIELYEE